ncbi:MAG: hypothetical protein H6Q98_110, partial [Nitrospirae bacterium]|nr:hypothetical protein [Nitrospirota bacterium]
GGTGVDTSGAAAPERADHDQERDADEDVDELVVVHKFLLEQMTICCLYSVSPLKPDGLSSAFSLLTLLLRDQRLNDLLRRRAHPVGCADDLSPDYPLAVDQIGLGELEGSIGP